MKFLKKLVAMKSLFNIKIGKRTIISSDINCSFHKKDGCEFNLFLLPSISIDKTANDVIMSSSINYTFTGWTKINFDWLIFNFCISIKNKC